MSRQATLKHVRKAGAFTNGELAAGEWGLDVTNGVWYFSRNGTTVEQLEAGEGGGATTLEDLTDVNISSLASGHILQYTGSEWVNRTLSAAGIAAASHTHVAANITDFDDEVEANTDVAANTAARHTHANSAVLAAITDEGSGEIITDGERTLLGTAIQASEKGAAGGVAELDGAGKVPVAQLPDTVLGAIQYKGAWDADTDDPDLSGATPEAGDYYVVDTAGATDLDGITDWKIGDWAVFNGTAWEKIDNTDQVSTVFGRQGTVVAAASDYDADQIDFDPAGGIAATNVQDAIEELDSEKAAASHSHAATDITSGDLATARMQTNAVAAINAGGGTINGASVIVDCGTL